MLIDQDNKNIDIVKNIILNRMAHKSNTEENILRSICKQTDLSRSESKKFLDKYAGGYWNLQKDENGINMYRLNSFYNLGGE